MHEDHGLNEGATREYSCPCLVYGGRRPVDDRGYQSHLGLGCNSQEVDLQRPKRQKNWDPSRTG